MSQQYFYDQQIRRWLLQFMRLFGGFSVKMGKDSTGNDIYHQVPVRYGDTNRMGQHIIRNNSENALLSVPAISCYIAEHKCLKLDRMPFHKSAHSLDELESYGVQH